MILTATSNPKVHAVMCILYELYDHEEGSPIDSEASVDSSLQDMGLDSEDLQVLVEAIQVAFKMNVPAKDFTLERTPQECTNLVWFQEKLNAGHV